MDAAVLYTNESTYVVDNVSKTYLSLGPFIKKHIASCDLHKRAMFPQGFMKLINKQYFCPFLFLF